MIKKYSSNTLFDVELEFYMRKIAALTIDQATPEQIQGVINNIATGSKLPPQVAQYAESAAKKLSSSVPKLQTAFPDPKKQIPEFFQAIQENPELLQNITKGSKTAIETRKKLRKFSRKINSINTEKKQILFLKKSGIIDEVGLFKLGKSLEEKGFQKIADFNLQFNKDEMKEIKKYLIQSGEDSRIINRMNSTSLAKKLAGKLGLDWTTIIANSGPDKGPKTILLEAFGKRPGSTAAGLFSRLSDAAGKAGKALGAGWGYVSKGLGWVFKYFRFIPAIYEFCLALYAIYKMIEAVGTITQQGTTIGLNSWYEPILSYQPLTSKFTELKAGRELEKLQTLGIVTNACKSFWQNAVDGTLSVVTGIINWIVFGAEAFAGIGTAGIGALAAIGLGFLASYIISMVKNFLSSWIGGAMTTGYTSLVDEITNFVQSTPAATPDGITAPTAPTPTAPTDTSSSGSLPELAAPGGEIPPTQRTTRRTAPPVTTPQESPMSRRDLRRERRLGRRQERRERRSLRRSERAARRAARGGLASTGASERIIQFIKLANSLDDQDLVEEADMIDNLLSQLA